MKKIYLDIDKAATFANLIKQINILISDHYKMKKQQKVFYISSIVLSLIIFAFSTASLLFLIPFSKSKILSELWLYFFPICVMVCYFIFIIVAQPINGLRYFDDPELKSMQKIQNIFYHTTKWINYILITLVIAFIGAKNDYVIQFIFYFVIFNFFSMYIQEKQNNKNKDIEIREINNTFDELKQKINLINYDENIRKEYFEIVHDEINFEATKEPKNCYFLRKLNETISSFWLDIMLLKTVDMINMHQETPVKNILSTMKKTLRRLNFDFYKCSDWNKCDDEINKICHTKVHYTYENKTNAK